MPSICLLDGDVNVILILSADPNCMSSILLPHGHTNVITGSALALHCCKAHAKINGKIENSTPCKIVTHEDFNLKLGTRDYVGDTTHHATLGSNRPSGK